MTAATGLTASRDFNFYISVDDVGYVEVDISGDNPSSTSLEEIVGTINNHYTEKNNLKFVTSTRIEDIETEILNNGKIATAYRDVSTNNGKIVISNSNGTPNITGINFSRFDCRDVTMSASNDTSFKRFFLAYYDTSSDLLKWTVLNNSGDKEINDRVLEDDTAGVRELTSVTLSNNKIALIYTTTTKAWVRLFDISGPSEITSSRIEIYPSAVEYIAAAPNQDGFVVTASIGAGGGIIIYLDNNGDYLINDDSAQSTATFQGSRVISNSSPIETPDGRIFIAYSNDDDGLNSYNASFSIWNNGSEGAISELVSDTPVSSTDVDLVKTSISINNNVVINYTSKSDGYLYNAVFDSDGILRRKEKLYYDSESVKDFDSVISTEGDLITTGVLDNSGLFYRGEYLGDIASTTFDDKIEFQSVEAGDTWDDDVENYAQASDEGHKFEMEGTEYVYDNYSSYNINQGIDFTDERNRFNTFYERSPNDDLVPIVQDTLTFLFTLIVGSNLFPAENVDKTGFYISRNSYISRSADPNVLGEDHRGYYTRHQDFSEDIRTDNNRVAREINWPQWKKGSNKKLSEVTNVRFSDDTDNSNSNYEGNYFIIYNGPTRFHVWYNLNGNTNRVYIDRSLGIEVQITGSDTQNDVAYKTAQSMNNHSIANFDVTINSNSISITSNVEGETKDAENGTLAGLIFISIGIQGSDSDSYADWSSWTMALDYFRPFVERPIYAPQIQKINTGGTAYPAGIYREFVYGVPTGVTAGAWLVEGDPTGTAVIEFNITDPNPSVVWPSNSKISYVEETTGKWKTVTTERSSDGKTLTATVDHFSIWGVINEDTGEVVSDDYTVDIDIDDAKIVRIEELTNGPSGLGTFGGTGAPYGPYQEFIAPIPTGGLTTTGSPFYERGIIFFAPFPVGGLTVAGVANYTYTIDYYYTSSGNISPTGKAYDLDFLEITIIFDLVGYAVNAAGAGNYKYADYNFFATGGITISGVAETSYYPIIIAKKPYGWITTAGASTYSRTVEYVYTVSGGVTIVETITDVERVINATLVVAPVLTNGISTYYKSISREAIPTTITTGGAYADFYITYTFAIEIAPIITSSPTSTSTGDLEYSYEYVATGTIYPGGIVYLDYITSEYIAIATTVVTGGTYGEIQRNYLFDAGRTYRKSSYDSSLNTENTNTNGYNSNFILTSHWPYYGDTTKETRDTEILTAANNQIARVRIENPRVYYYRYEAFYEYTPTVNYIHLNSKTLYGPLPEFKYQSDQTKIRVGSTVKSVAIDRIIDPISKTFYVHSTGHYTVAGNNEYLANVRKIIITSASTYTLGDDLYANFEYTTTGRVAINGHTNYSNGPIFRYIFYVKAIFNNPNSPTSAEVYVNKDYENYTPVKRAIRITSNHYNSKTTAFLETNVTIKNTDIKWLSVLSGPYNNVLSTWMHDDTVGWTYEDGSGYPSNIYNNSPILGAGYKVTASKLVENDIYVFAGENGRISNYKVSTNEWSYFDGSGAQNQPYDSGILVGEKIVSIEVLKKSKLIVFITTNGKVINYSLEFGYWTNFDSTTRPSGFPPNTPHSYGEGYTIYNTEHTVIGEDKEERTFAIDSKLYIYSPVGKIRARHPEINTEIDYITYNIPTNTPLNIATDIYGNYYYIRRKIKLGGLVSYTLAIEQYDGFYYYSVGIINTNSEAIIGILENPIYIYNSEYGRKRVKGGYNAELEHWYRDSFFQYYEQIIMVGQGIIYNYTDVLQNFNVWTLPDGSGGNIQPYLELSSDVYGAEQIELHRNIKPQQFLTEKVHTIAFYTNNGILNYDQVVGWTLEDGKTLYGTDGYQPYLNYTTHNITDIKNCKCSIVVANDVGELFNWDRNYGWTWPDGSGAGIGIYSQDILGVGNKINDVSRFFYTYLPLNPTEDEILSNYRALIVTGDNGRLGYILDEEEVKYNLADNIGTLEPDGIAGLNIDRTATVTGGKIKTGGFIEPLTKHLARTADGIAIVQSGAAHTKEISRTGSGGATTSGLSIYEHTRIFYYTASGTITLQGSSAFQETGLINYVQTASGDVISGGNGVYYKEITRTASGGAITSGASAYQETGL